MGYIKSEKKQAGGINGKVKKGEKKIEEEHGNVVKFSKVYAMKFKWGLKNWERGYGYS